MIVNYSPPRERSPHLKELSERLTARFAPRQPRVLIVDKSLPFRELLCGLLRSFGLCAETAASEFDALSLVTRQEPPDLLILELDATSANPFHTAEQLRLQGRETPIIFTAEIRDVETIVTALTYYAEDFVIKSSHPAELAARVRRVLLRTGPLHDDNLEHAVDNRLRINFVQQYAVIDGQRTPLTPTENRLLKTLYEHRGSVITPAFLLANAWKSDQAGSLESLWVHIRRLRSKIEPDPTAPVYVVTVRGRGYYLPDAPPK